MGPFFAIIYFEVNYIQEAEHYRHQAIEVYPMYIQHPNIVEVTKILRFDV
jgi:hypothetical protein